MVWEYSEKTKQLFLDAVHGKPGTHLGEIENPDGVGEHGSIACGDALRFTFRVERHPVDPLEDVITEAKYLTFGCTSAIASSEALCAIIQSGRYTPIEALKITNQDIIDYLGGLPDQKIHCSVMGAEALTAAVFNWAQRRGVDLRALGIDMHEDEKAEGRLVCKCFGATEPYIKRKIKELKLHTIREITAAIKAGGACTSCHHAPGGLQDLLHEVWGEEAVAGAAPAAAAMFPAGARVGRSAMMPLPMAASASSAAAPAFAAGTRVAAAGGPDGGHAAPSAGTVRELSPYQFSKKVEAAFDEYIRPMLRSDGGDLEIIDIRERLVYVRLVGACAGCFGAAMTMKMLIERTLKEHVDERVRVIAV